MRFGLGLFLLFALPALVLAAEFRGGDQVSIGAGQTIADDLYAGGGTVSIAGPVRGDLYAGGGTLLVSGDVGQDVVAGGGNVAILGDVGDDVRAGGGTVVVQGSVASDVVVGGGSVHLAGSRIGGDVWVGGGSVRVDASIAGDVRIGGGEIYLNGPIAGNVEIEAEKLTLGSEALIAGDLNYRSPKELIMEEGARVQGELVYEPRPARKGGAAIFAALLTVVALAKLLMHLASALFFVIVFPRYVALLTAGAYARPLLEIGRGFLALVAIPVASLLLLATVVGIPLGILGLIGFAGGVLVSCMLAPVVLGALLYKWWSKKDEYATTWKSAILGVFVYFILGFIPLLGWLVQAGFVLLSFGAMLQLKWRIAKDWR